MARFILSDLSVWPTVDIRSNGYKSIEDMQGGEEYVSTNKNMDFSA